MDLPLFLQKYDTRVPRYTSYPTAPYFSNAVTAEVYKTWLADLPRDEPISLYVHVPFCEQLCLYCGCNTAVVRKEAPRLSYAEAVCREIGLVAEALGHCPRVVHIHWGGGTPTALPAESLTRIMRLLRGAFEVADDAEIAVELDPRHLPEDRLVALAEMGVTRASLGVQDFAPAVQQAVGRVQSYEMTENVAKRLRAMGINSLNVDLMYGLPLQTVDSVIETTKQTLDLGPDRVAVFGYAHVPWMKRHQALMPEAHMPNAPERFAQRQATEKVLTEAGYSTIGLDHFAKPDDGLAKAAAQGNMQRNFQGYTSDSAKVLLGFGASSIGSLPQGYVQNAPKVVDYTAALRKNHLPVEKGIAFSADDKLRGEVIQELMCRAQVDLAAVASRHGADVADLLKSKPKLEPMEQDGLIRWHDTTVEVTQEGRPFVRSVAAAFDAYAGSGGSARHSKAI
jgi:oxygen-independent coproporphyrinogen-3 oxidase